MKEFLKSKKNDEGREAWYAKTEQNTSVQWGHWNWIHIFPHKCLWHPVADVPCCALTFVILCAETSFFILLLYFILLITVYVYIYIYIQYTYIVYLYINMYIYIYIICSDTVYLSVFWSFCAVLSRAEPRFKPEQERWGHGAAEESHAKRARWRGDGTSSGQFGKNTSLCR